MSDAIIVFVRNPVPGNVKTRLAKSIGEHAATTFYKSCADKLFNALAQLPQSIATYVFVDNVHSLGDVRTWLGDRFAFRSQCDGDLGERMHHAFAEVFAGGATKAIIIGTDIPDLGTPHVMQALRLLETHDVVLGPAVDGGYYLLGMKRLHQLFDNIDWGTDTVASVTRSKIISLGLTLTQLETLEDVDMEEAYRRALS